MKAAVKRNKWKIMGVIGRMQLMKCNMGILQKLNTVY